jgi:hypothetical protein
MNASSSRHLRLAPRGPHGLWAALAEASEPDGEDDSAYELAHLGFLQRLLAEIGEPLPGHDPVGDDLAEVVELDRFRSRRS